VVRRPNPEAGQRERAVRNRAPVGTFIRQLTRQREGLQIFLDDLIGEMAKLFPDQHSTFGGDDVNGKSWDCQFRSFQAFQESPLPQEQMNALQA